MLTIEEILRTTVELANDSTSTSAQLCARDAVKLFQNGNEQDALNRATQSLAYSVGVFSEVYREVQKFKL